MEKVEDLKSEKELIESEIESTKSKIKLTKDMQKRWGFYNYLNKLESRLKEIKESLNNINNEQSCEKMFIIRQKIKNEYINGKLADIDYITIGYVENEFLAQEFCNKHEDCTYSQIVPYKYVLELESELISDNTELDLVEVPMKKWEP